MSGQYSGETDSVRMLTSDILEATAGMDVDQSLVALYCSGARISRAVREEEIKPAHAEHTSSTGRRVGTMVMERLVL